MKKIYQPDKFSCYRACMASLLEMEFEMVPYYFVGGATLWNSYKQREWLKEHRLTIIDFNVIIDHVLVAPIENMLCIVSGDSPVSEHLHACVGQYIGLKDGKMQFSILHDPWNLDSREHHFRDGVTRCEFLIPLSPFNYAGKL